MTDLLGPGQAGASNALTTTSDVSDPATGDTFFQNCIANTPGTGTPIIAKWLNQVVQQIRRVIRNTNIALNNSDDDMLGQAIQSGQLNWAGTFGGSASALTATLTPVPAALMPGLEVSGLVQLTNPAAATLLIEGLMTVPVPIVAGNGAALVGGEMVIDRKITMTYDGVYFQLGGSSGGRQRLTANTTYYVNASSGSDSNNGSSAAPWLTLQHAANWIAQNLDLAGQTVTINCTGAFTAGIFSDIPWVGAGSSSPVTFNFTSGSSVTVVNGTCFEAYGAGAGFVVQTQSGGTLVVLSASGTANNWGYGVFASDYAEIVVSNVNFGACAVAQIGAEDFGKVLVETALTLSGAAQVALSVFNRGMIQTANSLPITLTGTPNYSNAFAVALDSSTIIAPSSSVSFSGSATGKRYSSSDISLIDTGGGGASFFPGNSSGTAVNSFNYQ